MLKYTFITVIIGFMIDFIIGDPHSFPHPVRLIGRMISALEKITRCIFGDTKNGQLIGGAVLWIIVCALSFCVPFAVVFAAYRLNKWLYIAVSAVMSWQCVAARQLMRESMAVKKALETGGIGAARKAVSMIVGRDTDALDEDGIIRAAVETVAENASDGVIAPLFYLMLGGAPLGFLYKAVNTMDSMLGYKNERYIFFGRFAARADDVFNFIPSRISAVLLLFAAFILRLDFKNALKIYKRDRKNHSSPNAAQTESVCAGALGVRLAGDAYYFGKLYKKPTIGDSKREINSGDIKTANIMMYTAAFAFLAMCAAVISALGGSGYV